VAHSLALCVDGKHFSVGLGPEARVAGTQLLGLTSQFVFVKADGMFEYTRGSSI